MSIKLSIITVVYNGASEIEKTINSVINQTYKNIEYIIIDGGSNDGTLQLINKYKKHIDFTISESDNGIYDAMNKGLDLASGDFINFLNCGDYFVNNETLDKMQFQLYSKMSLIYGDHYFLKDGNRTLIRALDFTLDNIKKFTTRVACHQSLFIRKDCAMKFSLKYKLKCELEQYFILSKKEITFKRHNFPIVYFAADGLGSQKILLNSYERLLLLMRWSPYNAVKNVIPFLKWSLIANFKKR